MEKLWKGRTGAEINRQADDFNASIGFDRRMAVQDIDGSVAHATMLRETGIVGREDGEAIVAGLNAIREDILSGALAIDDGAEDIHTFVELELTRRIGEAGKKLHTARSRNDQAALDLRMFLRDASENAAGLLRALVSALCDAAEKHIDTIMPGYTHMQRAQPVTFGHYLMAYAAMFLRDLARLDDAKKRLLSLPLGAGALAGTSFPIDRGMVCRLLGFESVAFNSIDAVSDRDFAAEALFICAVVMAHLSRLSEEMILYCSWEFRFLSMDDAFSTGSSIMPQKKNPDIAELIRGKTGRVYGSLIGLLTTVKGLPLAYNKDLQEDKQAVFDAFDTVTACLPLMTGMIRTLRVNEKNMYRAAAEGFLNATDCADYLAKKGMPFRDAYRITGEMVSYAEGEGKTLEQLTMAEYRRFSDRFSEDVLDEISLQSCVNKRDSEGGTSPRSVERQIKFVRGELRRV